MKRKGRKIISICLVFILSSTVLSGCFNYRDINKLIFITAMIIDIDEQENIVLYTEAFKPNRGAAQGTEEGLRLVFKSEGKTLFEAIRDASLASSYRNNYTQNRAIIITRRAAEKGIDKFIDFLDRDQEILLRAYMFVFDGDVKRLMQLNLKAEEYIGVYLYNLIQITGAASRAVELTLNQYLTRRLLGGRSEVITLLKIREDSPEDTIEIRGGAVVKENKMVDILARQDSQGYNFLTNRVSKGTLEITNPWQGDSFVTLEILNSRTKTEIKVEDGRVKVKKDIMVRASLGESQKSLVFDEATRETIERGAEHNIRKYSSQVFEEYKAKKVDIFGIEEELKRRYPNTGIKNPIEVSDLDITASIEIEGSSNKTNAR